MIMKKGFAFALFAVMFFSLFASFVSAQSVGNQFSDFGKTVWTVIQPLVHFLLGGEVKEPEILFAKLLIFTIVISLVWLAIKRMPFIESTSIQWIISAAVSVLAVRYLSVEWVRTIILPYTALGVALSAFFPLIVYLFFVEFGLQNYRSMRRIAWLFAGVVFIGLWFSRRVDIPDNSYIYLVAASVCLVFLLFDKTIQRAFSSVKTDNSLKMAKNRLIRSRLKELENLMEDFAHKRIERAEYDTQKRHLEKIIKDLQAS